MTSAADASPVEASPAITSGELPIIEASLDLIRWFVPLLQRLPRQHKFGLGDRLITNLYHLLEQLVQARYARAKLPILEPLKAHIVQTCSRDGPPPLWQVIRTPFSLQKQRLLAHSFRGSFNAAERSDFHLLQGSWLWNLN